MKFECNIFNGVLDKDCSNVVTFNAVLSGIRNGRWKERVEAIRKARDEKDENTKKMLKAKLPAVTWSGVFEERLDDACVVYNRVMVLDIDNISKKRLVRLKEELKLNPWVYAFFDGPTKGIKVLVFIDSELEWHNTHAFYHLEALFLELYDIQLDKTGKNPSRLCFVSYDPDLYINPNPYVLEIEKYEGIDSFHGISNWNKEGGVPETDSRKIFETCIKMVKKSKTGSYHKGNRNNFVFSLSCLMCRFGIQPEVAFRLTCERYSSLEHKEINNTVSSAYKRCKHEFGTMTSNNYRGTSQNNLFDT